MGKLIIRRFLIIGIISSLGFAHPFHVSITTFQMNLVSHSIENTLKLFSDDLEDAIQYDGLDPINLGSKNEYIKSDSPIFIKGNKWKRSCTIKMKSQAQFSLMKEILNDDIIRIFNH